MSEVEYDVERFEYKLEKAPVKKNRYTGLAKSDDAFATTLMDNMNALARDGWQFQRNEVMTETKRGGLLQARKVNHTYMVYRRPLKSDGMTLDAIVAPRRVSAEPAATTEELRDRIGSLIKTEATLRPVAI